MAEAIQYLSTEEVQGFMMEVMKALHGYCEKHGLRYGLVWGSLLGAVRHHGFIPWDDDMDIVMPREDYEKLKELEKQEPISPFVRFIDHYSNPDFHYTVSRACHTGTTASPPYLLHPVEGMGVWVDIVPADGYNRWFFLIQRPLLWCLNLLCNINNYALPDSAGRLKKMIQKVVIRCLPNRDNRYVKQMNSIMQWAKFSRSKQAIILTELENQKKEIFDRSDLEHPVPAEYEDALFYIPRNGEKMLERLYGNYMELPPEGKRMSHSYHALRKEQ